MPIGCETFVWRRKKTYQTQYVTVVLAWSSYDCYTLFLFLSFVPFYCFLVKQTFINKKIWDKSLKCLTTVIEPIFWSFFFLFNSLALRKELLSRDIKHLCCSRSLFFSWIGLLGKNSLNFLQQFFFNCVRNHWTCLWSYVLYDFIHIDVSSLLFDYISAHQPHLVQPAAFSQTLT